MSGRHLMEDRSSFLRHYPSTPHLDTFRGGNSVSPGSTHRSFNHHPLSGAASNMNLLSHSYMPKTTFSTFQQQKKSTSGVGLSQGNNGNDSYRYQDDPNPYKVSTIDEYRIKVNDPFVPNKTGTHRSSQLLAFYTQEGHGDLEDDEDEDVQEQFRRMEISPRRLSSSAYDEDEGETGSHHTLGYKVQRSATLKSTMSGRTERRSHMSGSASVSASSTGTGEIELDGEYIIPEPDYEGFRVGSSAGEEAEGGGSANGIIIPGPISDSSCTSSEGYSSVSAATSSSCSATDADPYAVPTTGPSSSPDEGSILEANDSGIETPTRISEKDRQKIEYGLMGQKTSIFVADCLANLYCMSKPNFVSRPNSSLSNQYHNGSYSGQSSSSSSSCGGEWILKYTGVPVLLLDLGETKSRDKRRIQIVLAELGSGLSLWKDVIDNLSSYKVMDGSHTFHTMHLSTDHTTIIGLSFDDEECAESFYRQVDKLTSDFANISLSGSKVKSKSKKDKTSSKTSSKTKFVKPKKRDISQPCGFSHISSLTSTDRKRFPSLQNFVVGKGTNSIGGGGGQRSADQSSVSSSSHEDFVSMSPLALADSHGSDLHF
ncbi:hypothetical protein Ocin01_05438 [Orchesella cincta]|uniref:WH1 domain-containing protein n=1 Tax=Orchesella cincta TaxID=48709 RepID=A0A1D2N7K2_ORCCI|nr:hypothetical protein Ocin01_05438 [Orchesella cincta]